MAPGAYFRCLLVGYFEGLDSERGIAWRTADSLSLRKFPGYALEETTPDHSTISRTRRFVLAGDAQGRLRLGAEILTEEGSVSGRTVSIDATTLEANAAWLPGL
jgi:transposase